MSNWYKRITSQIEENSKPLFKNGQDVLVDSPEVGLIYGVINSVGDYIDGEWQYEIMDDDTMNTITVSESYIQAQ